MPEADANAVQTHETYHAYLLRMWCSAEDGCIWQASLQDSKSGERIGFASLEGLFAYLMQTTEPPNPQSHPSQKRSL
jgi:hypothetical protein